MCIRDRHDPDAKQYQDRFDALLKRAQIEDRVSELGNVALEAAAAQRWPQALQEMDEAIKVCGACSQSAHLHKNLGVFYSRMGKTDEARREFQVALHLAPNDVDAKEALANLDEAGTPQAK